MIVPVHPILSHMTSGHTNKVQPPCRHWNRLAMGHVTQCQTHVMLDETLWALPYLMVCYRIIERLQWVPVKTGTEKIQVNMSSLALCGAGPRTFCANLRNWHDFWQRQMAQMTLAPFPFWSTTWKNMPGSCYPCPCPRYNGTLVRLCTLQRHASHTLAASVPSFSTWSWHLAGATTSQPSRSSFGSDVDDMGHSHCSSQDNSWPSKWLRSSTVHLSSPSLIPHCICIVSLPPMYALYLFTIITHTWFTSLSTWAWAESTSGWSKQLGCQSQQSWWTTSKPFLWQPGSPSTWQHWRLYWYFWSWRPWWPQATGCYITGWIACLCHGNSSTQSA